MDTGAFDISAAGMRAQRLRMDVIANNLANADTTSSRQETVRTADGRVVTRHVPFRRQMVVFMQGDRLGVSAPRVVDDPTPFRAEHDPGHPHAVPADSGADDAGMLYRPNVHPIVEMVDMISASRSYEANLSALDTFKAMNGASLRILA